MIDFFAGETFESLPAQYDASFATAPPPPPPAYDNYELPSQTYTAVQTTGNYVDK